MRAKNTHFIVTPLYRDLDWLDGDVGRSLDDLALEIDEFLRPIREQFDGATIFALLVSDEGGAIKLEPIDQLPNLRKSTLFNSDGHLQIAVVTQTVDWTYPLRKASQKIEDEFSAIGEFDGKVIWTFYENGECSDGYIEAKASGDSVQMQACANRPEHVTLLATLKNIHPRAVITTENDQPQREEPSVSHSKLKSDFRKTLFKVSVICAALTLIALNTDMNLLPRKIESFFEELTFVIFLISIVLSALTFLSTKSPGVRKFADPIVSAIEKLFIPPAEPSRSTDGSHWRLVRTIQWYALAGAISTVALLKVAPAIVGSNWSSTISNITYQIFLVSFFALIVTTLFTVSDPINKIIGRILTVVLRADFKKNYKVNSDTQLTFRLEYTKPQDACVIRWLDRTLTIEECQPSIDFIRCDDGADYVFLQVSKGDLENHSVAMFTPIKKAGPTDAESYEYFLCYRASFAIADESKRRLFLKALDSSNNQIQVVLQFNDRAGKLLEGCYEEVDSQSTTLFRS